MITALVADDDSCNREIIGRMLKRLGIEAEAVEDGAAALAQEKAYTYYFIDLVMPGLDGWATARGLKAQGRTGTFVAITGWDRACADSEGLFDLILQKPLTLDQLKAGLESLA